MTGDYTATDLCRILRVNESELRACLRAALLPLSKPRTPCSYSFQNLVMLRTAKGLTDAGVSVRRIRKVLQSLQRQLGEGAAMSRLKIYASGKRVVVWDGGLRWQPDSGQFLLNFDTNGILTTPSIRPRSRPPSPSSTESALAWFGRATALQDDSREEARRAYEEAIRLQPGFVEAHVNLGLLKHDAGDLQGAEDCYRRAIAHDPTFAVAHFNLGVVLEDQHDKSGAMAAYETAVRQAPEFREAHCNLAHLYEKLGRTRDAVRHYAAARRLQS